MSYLSTDEAYEYNDLACWYQNSIDETQSPIWTDEHLEELLNDFYIIPKDTPAADVVPKSEVEELSGRYEDLKLKYVDLVKDHDELLAWGGHIKRTEKIEIEKAVAREIFEELENAFTVKYRMCTNPVLVLDSLSFAELKKKHLVTDTNVGGKHTESEGKG